MLEVSLVRGLGLGVGLLSAGCGYGMMGSSMMDTDLTTQLLSVSPRGGATGVAILPNILLTFSQPMMPRMEQYVALHQGGIAGPTVPMNCGWSDNRVTLTCRPDEPLGSSSAYAVHMGGGMMDASGQRVGMRRYGMDLGGSWTTRGMMGGRLDMMGSGWMHGNGSYGMVFEFTTQ